MAAAQYIEHITLAGDRWDLIAWNYYGDPALYSALIISNPAVAVEPVFEAGVRLVIPILPKNAVTSTDLPPWKRTIR